MKEVRWLDICKSYQGKRVLDHVSALLPSGRVSCLMAPSGSGKTTLLRILLGLERPDQGQVIGLENQKISAVFQEDRLCGYLSPEENIRLVNPQLAPAVVSLALESVGLGHCQRQPCRELSGGMARRVALLRALMFPHQVLFLDEPFKGLDADTKNMVMAYTATHCKDKTVLLVTHDSTEAQALGAVRMLTLEPKTAGG